MKMMRANIVLSAILISGLMIKASVIHLCGGDPTSAYAALAGVSGFACFYLLATWSWVVLTELKKL